MNILYCFEACQRGRVISIVPRLARRSLQTAEYPSTLFKETSKFVKIKPVRDLKLSNAPDYISSPNSKLHALLWPGSLQNVLVTKKPWSCATKDAMITFINHLHTTYPEINVILQPDVAEEVYQDFLTTANNDPNRPHMLYSGTTDEITSKADLLVTLGGDGTILHGVSMFKSQVPPVLAFSLGTLGFLLPFDFKEHKEIFNKVLNSRAKCLHRTRLECHVIKKNDGESSVIHAMNDIFLHRGSSPHLTNLDIFVDGEFLTRTIADGVVFSSPTGSTAYSLSAGGSIVSPLIPSILLTPICPRSLSFRPLILPHSSHIKIRVCSKMNEKTGNNSVNISVDGVAQNDLEVGDEIHIVNEVGTIYIDGTQVPPSKKLADETLPNSTSKQRAGIYCIAKSENDWIKGINDLLGFNSGFRFTRRKQDN
ncbi:hypothetical protein KAFR_0B06770 [Kazachstania africana CBS 2517]|uniref:NAD+ kinase n=1 Tax=Kazachstania africana (strain ATCC 22294 / BCRC 22015 / CBS 2517 / CECT 1963 / NBRC 1671 / NRRL Y-8276) TaxID=1071382 RepID=H2ARH4_KAZAF|nr:hypothetical protein KAFR_0B06770 [Kazachstania africana CBS 2517]CCF56974.1 hypothetical protein KAFR_0B06770 [Kazachstania africana CBS 2517]